MSTQSTSPFYDLIEEEDPKTIFDMFRPRGNQGSPAQRRFFQNSFNDIFGQYTKGILETFRNAQSDNPLIVTEGGSYRRHPSPKNLQAFLEANPQQSFSGFLQDFPFSRRFSNLTRSERGSNPAAFAPTTRTLF